MTPGSHLCPFRGVFLGGLGPSGAAWGFLGLPGALLGSFGASWGHLGLPEASWDSFGDVWVLLGPPGASWFSWGFLGLDWIRTEFCVLAFKIRILAAIPKGNLPFRRPAGAQS